ncbi:MAG TPA: ABC transporter permease [Gemmatimonadaceae bacterium]|nr:ABC transporter permease [Gemmatimonadaceae bacterium]
MSTLRDDIRYALRRIRREPSFAAFAVFIMAVGVAAVTSVFSVVSPLMLRPLPFANQDRLVWIAGSASGGMSAVTSRSSNLRDYRLYNRSFEAVSGFFAFFDYGSFNLVGDGLPERLVGVGVAQNFLPVLGVRPALGRNFTDEESVWGGRKAAILTHGFWTRRFGADPKVIGHSMTLNGNPTEIVGVLPQWFDFASTFAPSSHVDFLEPFPISAETDQWGNTLSMIARLRPGVSVAAAQADLDRINNQLKAADQARWGLNAVVSDLHEHIAGGFRAPLIVLAAAAGLVLAVACGNLSNLMLVRAQQRAKEMSVRSALGATRRRLIVQLLTESLILAACGGVLGVLLAFAVTKWVAGTTAVSIPMLRTVSVDASALGFTLVATLLTGLIVGIAPALQLSEGREWATLGEASRGSSEGRRTGKVREGLVVGEVALAFLLLVSGGLLLRSFVGLLEVDLGFRPEGAMMWQLEAGREFATKEARLAYFENLTARVREIPGVEAVGATDTPPLGRNRGWTIGAKGATYDKGERPGMFPRLVDSEYLQTMKIPLVDGRYFTRGDRAGTQKVAVINRTAAAKLFPGGNAVGQTLLLFGPQDEWQVVGVVADVRHQALDEESGLEVYFPYSQLTDFSTVAMVVRSRVSPTPLAESVKRVLRTVDPALPVGDYQTLGAVVDRAISPRKFILLILGGFAGTALLLAALGIYAVLSYSVSQRVREIGIRMALGESASSVRRRVVGRTLVLAGIGVAIGAVTAVGASRLLRTLLYGIGPTDLVSFVGTAALLVAVSAVAGFLPARRASRTDPIVALRSV